MQKKYRPCWGSRCRRSRAARRTYDCRPPARPESSPRSGARRTAEDPRPAALRALPGQGPERSLRHPAGRGNLSVLGPDHVPHSGAGRRGPRAPRSTPSSPLSETATAGHRRQPSLELGHHQAARAAQMDLLLSLRDPGHLQPLRRRLDGRRTRSAGLAKRLIGETGRKQNIAPHQLTLHADRGSSMTSQPVALLLADLGVTQTHSRPHVSDDNPFWESQFKTLKYRPEFPERFGSIQDARAFCQSFFPRYNAEHHHSGSRPAHARGAPRRTGRRGHRPTPGGPQPGFPKKSRTLRPGEPPTPGATCRGMDQPSARTGRERTAATRIYAGRCLKVIDKFRSPNSFAPLGLPTLTSPVCHPKISSSFVNFFHDPTRGSSVTRRNDLTRGRTP